MRGSVVRKDTHFESDGMLRGRAEGVSNGLSGERKFRFFEELIEEDDELPHDGGQRDLLGFTGNDETLVKRL